MRLWHYALIRALPRQQLLGQHRECCALRGNGWGKKHSTVNYVFRRPRSALFRYHTRVMDEMTRRGYKVSEEWRNPFYRGKNCEPHAYAIGWVESNYPEHDDDYLEECVNNLRGKGVNITLDRNGLYGHLHLVYSPVIPVERIQLNLAIP